MHVNFFFNLFNSYPPAELSTILHVTLFRNFTHANTSSVLSLFLKITNMPVEIHTYRCGHSNVTGALQIWGRGGIIRLLPLDTTGQAVCCYDVDAEVTAHDEECEKCTGKQQKRKQEEKEASDRLDCCKS